jgi:hypothetical protein
MGRAARRAAVQQQAALIQQLWAENERLKAALKQSQAAKEHPPPHTLSQATHSSPAAALYDCELPSSPGCSAFKTPLSPQQQQHVLGDLLKRLQQGGENGSESMQLEELFTRQVSKSTASERTAFFS